MAGASGGSPVGAERQLSGARSSLAGSGTAGEERSEYLQMTCAVACSPQTVADQRRWSRRTGGPAVQLSPAARAEHSFTGACGGSARDGEERGSAIDLTFWRGDALSS
jgi:hypothetical protein